MNAVRGVLKVVAVVCVLAILTLTAPAPATAQTPATQPDARASLDALTKAFDVKAPRPAADGDEQLPPQAAELLAEARALADNDRGVLATVKLEQALRYAPRSRQIHRLLGRIHAAGDNPAKAELHLQRALAQGGDDPQAWLWLGLAQAELGRQNDAIKSLLTARLCSPAPTDSPVALRLPYELGKLLDEQGYPAAALPLLETVYAAVSGEKLSPAQKSDPALSMLQGADKAMLAAQVARLRVALGQSASAVQLIETLPPEARAAQATQISLMLAYRQQGQADKARATLRKLFVGVKPAEVGQLLVQLSQAAGGEKATAELLASAGPADGKWTAADAPLALATAESLRQAGQSARAAEVLGKLISAVPDAPAAAYATLFDLQIDQPNKLPDAAATLRGAISRHPADGELLVRVDKLLTAVGRDKQKADAVSDRLGGDDFASRYLAGRLAGQVGDFDAAVKLLEQSTENKADFAAGYIARMSALLSAKKFDQAVAVAGEAGKAGIESADVHQLAGRAHLAAGRHKEAVAELTQARRLGQENVQILLDLAAAYRADGQPAAAMRNLRRAYELEPRNVAVLVRLAEANLEADQLDEVVIYTKKAMEIEPDNVDLLRLRAMALVRNGDLQTGLRLLEELAKKTPDDAAVRVTLGQVLMQVGKPEAAVKHLQRALALDEKSVQARRLLAEAFRLTGKLDEAIEQMRLLAETQPADEVALGSLAGMLIARERLDEAAAMLDKLDKTRPMVARELVATAMQADKVELALKVAKGELARADDAEQRRQWLAISLALLLRQGHKEQAIQLAAQTWRASDGDDTIAQIYTETLVAGKQFDKALAVVEGRIKQTGDDDAETRLQWQQMRVLVLTRMGRKDDALAAARKLYEDDPKAAQRVLIYIAALGESKKFETILKVLDQAKADQVDLPDQAPQRLRMQALVQLGRLDEARKALDAWLEASEPGQRAMVWYLASNVYQQGGKLELCRAALEQALKLDPKNPHASNDLGYQLADDGVQLERAEKLVRSAVEQQPGEAAYIDSLAWVLYKQAKWEQAAKLMAEAVRMEPDSAVMLDHYGDILYRLGQRDKALEQWKKSLEAADPDEQLSVGEQSSPEKTRAKVKAVQEQNSSVPVAPLGEGISPPGTQRI